MSIIKVKGADVSLQKTSGAAQEPAPSTLLARREAPEAPEVVSPPPDVVAPALSREAMVLVDQGHPSKRRAASTGARVVQQQAASFSNGERQVPLPVRGGPGVVLVSQAEAALIEELKSSSSLFRNGAFWDFFAAKPELAEDRIRAWYGSLPGFDDVVKKAAVLGEHRVLLLDPGIVQRLDAFVELATRILDDEPSISTMALRQRFSDSLPKVELWRGMMLQDHEARALLAGGMRSMLFRPFRQQESAVNGALAASILGKQAYGSFAEGPVEDIRWRLSGVNPQNSMYASFSTKIEVTYAGAWRPRAVGGGPTGPGNFHLFKVRVSELDVIRGEGIFSELRQDRDGSRVYRTKSLDGGEFVMPFHDPTFELFVQSVAADEIVEHHRYDQMPPLWG